MLSCLVRVMTGLLSSPHQSQSKASYISSGPSAKVSSPGKHTMGFSAFNSMSGGSKSLSVYFPFTAGVKPPAKTEVRTSLAQSPLYKLPSRMVVSFNAVDEVVPPFPRPTLLPPSLPLPTPPTSPLLSLLLPPVCRRIRADTLPRFRSTPASSGWATPTRPASTRLSRGSCATATCPSRPTLLKPTGPPRRPLSCSSTRSSFVSTYPSRAPGLSGELSSLNPWPLNSSTLFLQPSSLRAQTLITLSHPLPCHHRRRWAAHARASTHRETSPCLPCPQPLGSPARMFESCDALLC